MEAEPSSRMSMPLEIEAVAANPVQASEWRVEFFAEVLWLTGSITLDEPIAGSMPFAEDIDWVVELSGADCRQESRLQHLVDKPLTCDRDDGLFRIRQAPGSTFRCQAATFLGSVVFRQFQGSSSSSRWTGCSAMRESTSASQASGSTSLNFAVVISVAIAAARSAPRSEPANCQDFLPNANPRSARSAALFVRQTLPSSRKRANRSQRLSM